MRSLNGLVLSLVLALAGAALWFALSRIYDTWLLVILAALVGGLAGYGMALGTKAKGGAAHGLLAALTCLVACLAAKGAIAWCRAADFVDQYATVTEEDAYDHLVDQTYRALVDEGVLHGDETSYPLAVYDTASEQWRAMTHDERQEYIAAVQLQWQNTDGAITGVASAAAFLFSWGLLDIFCVGSAVATAFKIGSKQLAESDEEIPAWALGPGRALTATPQSAASLNSTPLAPLATPVASPTAAGKPRLSGTTPPADAAPASATDSFWTRLGSEPPARDTPSLRRTPKPAHDSGEQARSEAA